MFQIGRTHSVKEHNIAAYNTCQKYPNMFGLHIIFLTRTTYLKAQLNKTRKEKKKKRREYAKEKGTNRTSERPQFKSFIT